MIHTHASSSQEVIHLDQYILDFHKARRPPPPEVENKFRDKPKRITRTKMDDFISKLKQYHTVRTSDETSNDNSLSLTRQIELLSAETQKAFKRSLTLITSSNNYIHSSRKDDSKTMENPETMKQHAISKISYYEDLDYLFCASHDGNICKWSSVLTILLIELTLIRRINRHAEL